MIAASWIGSASASMNTSQWQCGIRSAGVRGGRWTGRQRARGLLATALASKVGSSMWWHIETTAASPYCSTSSSAPQCASQNAPRSGALEPIVHVHVLVREADVELEALEDRLDGVAGEAHLALHAARVDRAGTHPLVDGDRLARLGADLHVHVRQRGAIEEVAEQHVLAAEHRELGAGQTGDVDHARGVASSRRRAPAMRVGAGAVAPSARPDRAADTGRPSLAFKGKGHADFHAGNTPPRRCPTDSRLIDVAPRPAGRRRSRCACARPRCRRSRGLRCRARACAPCPRQSRPRGSPPRGARAVRGIPAVPPR